MLWIQQKSKIMFIKLKFVLPIMPTLSTIQRENMPEREVYMNK